MNIFPFEPRHKRHKQAAERKKKIPLELFQLACYEPMKSADLNNMKIYVYIYYLCPHSPSPAVASTHDSVFWK